MIRRIALPRLLRTLCILPFLAILGGTPAHAAADGFVCTEVNLPVSNVDGGVPGLTMAGTFCRPDWQVPNTVQFLVHGGTYTRQMWDWQQEPDTYSYMRSAVRAGYATLSVDRIGHGGSTKPPSQDVTVPRANTALHDAVTALRAGNVGGIAFKKVVWVGHSLGAVHGYDYGGRFSDIDAYAFIGSVHFMKPSWLGLITNSVQPAGPDAGYLTTIPGTRDDLFYNSVSDPLIVARDEALKDTLTNSELVTGLALVNVAAAQSPTQQIRVPVAVYMGEFDNIVCGPPDGVTCTAAAIRQIEAPYFTKASRLDVVTVSSSAHSILHLNAPALYSAMGNWIRQVAPPL